MKDIWTIFSEIMQAVPATLLMALLILLLSLAAGTVLALVITHKTPLLSGLAKLYISVIRGTPLLVQLFICYYTLPSGIQAVLREMQVEWDKNNLSPLAIIIVTYTLYYATYQQETVLAAFASIPPSQRELADSLGYPYYQTLLRVIAPQALVYSLPNLFNTFLSVMKALSLGFMIAVIDIFAKAKLVASLNGQYLATFAVAALVYWLICLTFSKWLAIAEKKLAYYRKIN